MGFELTILKLTGTACLALALISILTINLINSNYYSPKLANAVSTNTTNASSSSPYISLSLSSATGSSDPSNGSNIAIQLPDAGGLATGSHTLTIKTNAVKGYNVTLSSNSEQTGLTNTDGTTTIPTITTNGTLANNTWGYSIGGNNGSSSSSTATYHSLKPLSAASKDVIKQSTTPTIAAGDTTTITYGVRVDSPSAMKAGDYTAEVVYTATANLPAAPTITKIEPNTINVGESKIITVTGQNLASTYEAYIDFNNNNTMDGGETCSSSLTVVSDTAVACIAPAYNKAGAYNVHILAQGGESETNNNSKLTYQTAAIQAIGTMQDPNISTICANTATPNASATQIDSTGEHAGDKNYVPEKTMTDIRDNKTYKVRKLADGNCWMVENLALGTSNSSGMTLTDQDTDLQTQTSFTLPAFSSVGSSWDHDDNTPHVIQGSTANGGGSWTASMGNWYTWGAATANTAKNATSSGTKATDSICPAGWQLPDNTGTKSYYNLITTIYKQSTGSAISQAPLSFTYAGDYDYNGFVRNSDVGSLGHYWSSTANNKFNAFLLYFDSGNINPQADYIPRGLGFSVRCVVQ